SVFRQNVLSLPPSAGIYDLLFMDAPYNQGLSEPALRELAAKGWLKPGALCLVEVEKNEQLHIPACYEWQEERIYGLAKVIFLKYVSGPQQEGESETMSEQKDAELQKSINEIDARMYELLMQRTELVKQQSEANVVANSLGREAASIKRLLR